MVRKKSITIRKLNNNQLENLIINSPKAFTIFNHMKNEHGKISYLLIIYNYTYCFFLFITIHYTIIRWRFRNN